MTYLADTSVLIYLAQGDAQLPPLVSGLVAAQGVVVYASAVSAYEIGNKYRLGKLPGAEPITAGFSLWAASMGFRTLDVKPGECMLAGLCGTSHRDPWDRILAEQARSRRIPILSPDRIFDSLGVERIW